MNAAQICKKYNISESSLKSNFKRTNESLIKKFRIKLEKSGRGRNVEYSEVILSDERALTVFEEPQVELIMDNDSFKFINWEFIAFIGIIATPFHMFRGTLNDFLDYNGIAKVRANAEKIEEALSALSERGYIQYDIDEDYIIVYIKRKVEKDFKVEFGMLDDCRKIAEKGNKKSWVPIFKTWVAVNILVEDQPFTQQQICDMTGMSKYLVRESIKQLEGSNIFKTSKAYQKYGNQMFKCLGTSANLNVEGFYAI